MVPESKEIIATFQPSGKVARVSSSIEKVGDINGIPTYKVTYGDLIDVPEPEDDVLYIVSGLVFGASDRTDLIQPNTGMAIRDENGRIIGVPGFIVK